MFPGCSFSLIDMALGKYNAPSGDYTDVTGYHPSYPVIPIGPSGTYATDDDHDDDDVSENWTRYNMK